MSRVDPSDPNIATIIRDVFDVNTPTNWCVIGYVPKSTKLKVVGSGTGDWQEMAEDMDEGKILYGLCRFKVNEVFRFLYLSWCGEGVQGMLKGMYNNHAHDMQQIFRGYHAQINARGEHDLDEAVALKKLKQGIGADYEAGQVIQGAKKGTAVQRSVKTEVAIDKQASEEYWEQQKGQEAETKSGYVKVNDFQNIADRNKYWQDQQAEAKPAAAPARPAVEVKAQTGSLKSKFEQLAQPEPAPAPQRVQGRAPPPKKIGGAAPAPAPAAAPAPAPSKPTPAPAPAKAAPPPVAARAPAPAPAPAYVPEPEPEPVAESYDEGYYDESGEGYYEEAAEGEYYEEAPAAGGDEGYYEEAAEEGYYEEEAAAGGEYYDESAQETATALYNYPGEADGDLVFNQGDIIVILDRTDEGGWWQGELNGVTGYFPSNFVKLN